MLFDPFDHLTSVQGLIRKFTFHLASAIELGYQWDSQWTAKTSLQHAVDLVKRRLEACPPRFSRAWSNDAKLAWEWNEQHGLSHGNGTNGMAGVKLSNHHSLWRSLFMFFPSFFILYRKVQVWSKKWLTLVNQSTTPKLPELFLALINSQTLRTRLAQWPVWCLSQVKDTAEIYQQGLAKWKAYELLEVFRHYSISLWFAPVGHNHRCQSTPALDGAKMLSRGAGFFMFLDGLHQILTKQKCEACCCMSHVVSSSLNPENYIK